MNTSKLTVCVLDNGSQLLLNRTLDSLKGQTFQEFEYKIVDFSAFWKGNRHSLHFGADYVLYLYSGSMLKKDALEIIMNTIDSAAPQWLYFDEKTYDAAINGEAAGINEKPDFGIMGFLGNVYTGEGVVFSKEILDGMTLKYDGKNFGVAMQEMAIAAAAQADAVHIRSCLLQRHKRMKINPGEWNLLIDALNRTVTERKLNLSGKGRSGVLGLELVPEKENAPSISVILMAKAGQEVLTNFGDGVEVIVPDASLSYLEKCKAGAGKAKNQILCFADASCAVPSREDLNKMAAYAELPCAGCVSPSLQKEDSVIYTGTFGQAGKRFRMEETVENIQSFSVDVRGVRETAMPAWEFWMADKALALGILNGIASEDLPQEHLIMKLGYRAAAMGRKNLYLGNVAVRYAGEETGAASEGFCRMLFNWKDQYIQDPYCPRSIKLWMREDVLKGVTCYFPQKMDAFDPERKKVFVLTHELSLTGAPVVLSHAAHILKEEGWQVVVVSPTDGVLKREFLRDGMPVFIVGDMNKDTDWLRLASDFDLILINTVVPFRQIEQLRDFKVPVMWWLHDARSGYEDYLRHALPADLGDNIHTFSVSKYADDVVKEFRPKYKTGLLLYGLKDEAERVCAEHRPIENAKGRKVFISVGTIIHRKGQDILAKAVRLLPEKIRKQCLFLVIGKPIDADIYQAVVELAEDFPEEVELISAVAHDDIFNLYKEAAAVICSSRDDPLPTFMAETMMVSGVCICSENTGTAGVIENGRNGYVYTKDDPAELAKCIQYVVEYDDLDALKKESRRTFDTVFSMDIFRKNLLNCVKISLDCEKGDK